ncbi:MAG: PSD1 and planctomycete cytochrome C domain-containing protein [Planctomycetota bacterium]
MTITHYAPRLRAFVAAAISVQLLCGFSYAIVRGDSVVDYAQDVQPILAKHCYACHGPDESEGGLRFHESDGALVEGESGEIAIVPGEPDASHLLVRITTDDEWERMPPEGQRVSEAEVELLKQWIADGAQFAKHWSFEPLSNPTMPSIDTGDDNAIEPIDAFLHNRRTEAGVAVNPPADRATLIRRVTYGLTGLPPSASDVEAFVSDSSPDAYARLIGRLLESHHYGERWGRHWLDLVRYAETNSFERDGPKPNAWKFRDYVIRSFNDDKPYDQFIREQLAGDLLQASPTVDQLTATGFYRLGIWDDEPADPLQARYDELDDLITTTSQAFLGLTINCARCHDHKIDPIPQTDYYGLVAFFADVSRYGTRRNQTSNNQIDVSSKSLRDRYASLDELEQELTNQRIEIEQIGIAQMSASDQRATEGPPRDRKRVLDKKLQSHLESEQWHTHQDLVRKIADVRQQRNALPPRDQVLGLNVKRKPEQTFVLFRGNPHSPADPVDPQFPDLFDVPPPKVDSSDRRLVLANWIASPENRLTARVMVNRIWQHHFGRGIVRSPNNFGGLGIPPTHPKLLDFLAQQFIRSGWSMKALHRQILLSDAYQMASSFNPDAASVDPGNDLFWRFDPRRLSAEEVRDTILMTSNRLNRTPYGESFYPKVSAEVLAGQSRPGKGWGQSDDADRNRRSVYIHIKRSLLPPMLSAFDFPEPDTTCEERFATLQPAQAMSLLNSEFIHRAAADLASAVEMELDDSVSHDAFVAQLIKQTLARQADLTEIKSLAAFIEELQFDYGVSAPRARMLAALAVLNWNEFVFVF